VEATQTPSHEHEKFDQLCAEVEEFDHLPAVVSPALARKQADEGGDPETDQLDPEMDQLILAGLVSPL
jgi:hypothetical protein